MPNKKHLAKYALISTLKSSRPEARAHLIGYLNDSGIKLLSEAVFNVLFNNLSLSKREIKVKRGLSKISAKNTTV